MPISLHLIAIVLMWLLLVTGLKAVAAARRADELEDRNWAQLGRMHSQSGIAFFPTSHARLELEVAIATLRTSGDREPTQRRPPA